MALQDQKSRWAFTINNYSTDLNFKQYLSHADFRIKRAVWGYEVSPGNGTRHIQGYLELQRTFRICHVRKIFSTAHWSVAYGTALKNFQYCTKGGNYDAIGDFSAEEAGLVGGDTTGCASVPMVISGLLNEKCALQVKVSKEYALRHVYYDKVTPLIKNIIRQNKLFDEWKQKKLFMWQYKVFTMLLTQPKRKILWLSDPIGNNGKTFLANYLSVLYGFSVFDGTINSRDIGLLLDSRTRGFCFDVSRASIQNFDYAVLESLKNGYVVSGKYKGHAKRFNILPIVVFSNFYPTQNLLSADRWHIVTLGEGELTDLSKDLVISPSLRLPFLRPPQMPDLSEEFDLKGFLQKNLPQYRKNNEISGAYIEGNNEVHTSQIPETSTAALQRDRSPGRERVSSFIRNGTINTSVQSSTSSTGTGPVPGRPVQGVCRIHVNGKWLNFN